MGHHAKAGKVLDAKLSTAVIALVKKYDLVPCREFAHQQADHGGHAARIDDRILGSFEGRNLAFDHLLVGIPIPTVLLAVMPLTQIV
jgi:hypothetical protein